MVLEYDRYIVSILRNNNLEKYIINDQPLQKQELKKKCWFADEPFFLILGYPPANADHVYDLMQHIDEFPHPCPTVTDNTGGTLPTRSPCQPIAENLQGLFHICSDHYSYGYCLYFAGLSSCVWSLTTGYVLLCLPTEKYIWKINHG